jgi:uncharacterized membrane protein HdeD (DUF308 family)
MAKSPPSSWGGGAAKPTGPGFAAPVPPVAPLTAGGPLVVALARNWLLILFRGACAIGFGLFAFTQPGSTLTTLVMLYGAYAIFDGAFALSTAVFGGAMAPRWWLAIAGAAGIAAGVTVMTAPFITMMILMIFIACWAISVGALQILGAFKLRREIEDEWTLAAAGGASVAFGLLPMAGPALGTESLAVCIGAYAVVHGVILIALALRLQGHRYGHPR